MKKVNNKNIENKGGMGFKGWCNNKYTRYYTENKKKEGKVKVGSVTYTQRPDIAGLWSVPQATPTLQCMIMRCKNYQISGGWVLDVL